MEERKLKVYTKYVDLKCEDEKDNAGQWKTIWCKDNIRYKTRSAVLWQSILTRVRLHNRYSGADNDFESFQVFADWCQDQPNYMNKESNGKYWALDKDIITPFNKSYSETTCCFIPSALNSLLCPSTRVRGDAPLGVHWDKAVGYYKAQMSSGTRPNGDKTRIHLGISLDPMECHKLWQAEKVKQILQAREDYDFLPENVLHGLWLHAMIIQSDLDNGIETVR